MINVSSIAKPSTFVRKKAGFTDSCILACFSNGKADFTDRFLYVRRKILGHMLRFVKS